MNFKRFSRPSITAAALSAVPAVTAAAAGPAVPPDGPDGQSRHGQQDRDDGHSPVYGHAVPRIQMEEEIMMMKRANINHIRNSHYQIGRAHV